MEPDIEAFICEVEKRPGLYDKQLPEYSDKRIKEKLWIELCEEMCPDWSNLGAQERMAKALAALAMVYEKADSVRSVYVNAPACLHKYIIGRKGEEIRRIRQNFPKVYVEYIDKDERIKIEGPPEEVDEAQKSLEAKVQDLVSRLVFDEITVDPKFYKHIIGKSGANVNRMKEEAGVMINIGEKNGNNVIRIEGDRAGVAKAKKELEDMVHKLENEKEKDLIIDHRFYKSIIGAKCEKIGEIREKYNQVQITFPNLGDKRDVVTIRGPREDVDKCSQHLLKLVKELGENSFSLEVPIYKQFHKFIIGKRGANIQKIRDETQTKIELPAEGVENDVITITGKKDNVEEARKRIQKIQNELANIVTEEMSIPPRLYHSLIGPRGKLINSIMEDCGGVNIKFPSAESNSDNVVIRGPKEDVEKAKQLLNEMINERQRSDHYAEVRAKAKHHRYLIRRNGAKIRKLRESTGARIMFPKDKDDDKEVITIVGTKEAVDKAKAELEAVIADMDNIVEAEMKVDPKHHRHFVARRGEVLSQISEQLGDIRISFPRFGNISDRVTLKGSKDCIKGAKARIQEIVDELDSMVTIECVIPQKHHRSMMGAKGKNVQSITSEFEVQIKFPERDTQEQAAPQQQQQPQWQPSTQWSSDNDQDSWGTGVTQVQWAPSATQDEWGTSVTQEQWPSEVQHNPDQWQTPIPTTVWESNNPMNGEGVLLAVEGADEAKTQDDNQLPEPHAEVDMYQQMAQEVPAVKPCDIVRITGKKGNCEAAKAALLALEPVTIEVSVPFDYHRLIIGKKGRVVKEMRDRYDVNIVLSPAEKKLDIIKISGCPAAVEKAKEAIEEKCRQLDEEKKEKALQSFELKIEVDPDYHPKIIGKKGTVINKIRSQNNVQINFPKKGDPEEHIITITGYEEAAKAARYDIMKIVNALNEMVKAEVNIDPRIYSRLIGARGRNIHKIMEQYGVDIKFPRPTASPADAGIVTISGLKEAVLDAKDHLLNLEEEYVNVPFDYRRPIIKKKVMRNRYDVNVVVPPAEKKLDIIKISGHPATVEKAKEAIEEKCHKLDEKEKEKALQSFELKIEVDPDYLSIIIGKKGTVIKKIKSQNKVQINIPKKGDPEEHIITITGYEDAAKAARDDIMKIVNDLDEMPKEKVNIDPRVHSWLLGDKSLNIRKIMERYGVDIKFPRPTASPADAGIVTIRGPEKAVLDAKNHLLNLEEKYNEMVEEEVNIDPRVQSWLIGAKSQNIRKKIKRYGVIIKYHCPTASPADAVIVTIRGPEKAVLDAKNHLLNLEEKYNEMVEEVVNIDPRVHSWLIGKKSRNIRKIMKRYGVDIKYHRPTVSSKDAGIFTIRGPEEAVLDAKNHLLNLEEKYNEMVEEEVNIDPRVHSWLIGAKSRNIRKIMKRYGVDIKYHCPTASPVNAGIVTIRGPEEAFLNAKNHMLNLEEKYNEMVEEVNIDPRVHSWLTGDKSRNIRKIIKCYGVDLKFSRPTASPADAGIVTIRGPEVAVLDAKVHLRNLEEKYNEMVEEEVNIDPRVHSWLIGAKSRNIRKIMKRYGVDIKYHCPTASPVNAGIVTIRGPEEAFLNAKNHMLNLEEKYNEMVEEVNIDPRVHSWLTGDKSRNIRKIIKCYGVDLKFSRPTASPADAGIVTIRGPEVAVLDAKVHLRNLEEKYLLDLEESLRSE